MHGSQRQHGHAWAHRDSTGMHGSFGMGMCFLSGIAIYITHYIFLDAVATGAGPAAVHTSLLCVCGMQWLQRLDLLQGLDLQLCIPHYCVYVACSGCRGWTCYRGWTCSCAFLTTVCMWNDM